MANYDDNEETSACQERWRAFCQFLHDRETGQVLGRTGKSWALIGLFYLVFYSALAGFFVGMLAVFLNTVIEDDRPRLTGKQSLLKLNPGVSFFPLPNYKSTLVKFKKGDKLSYVKYKEDIEAKLNRIKMADLKPAETYAVCNQKDDTKNPDDPKKVCRFQPEFLGACNSSTDYGYKIGQPCIFVKMNKVYGWIPDVKDGTKNPYIVCKGETDADAENLGSVQYFPEAAENSTAAAKISNIYYPYLNQKGYITPVAAIQFTKLTKNVLIMIRCSLHGLKTESLSVRLEMLMD